MCKRWIASLLVASMLGSMVPLASAMSIETQQHVVATTAETLQEVPTPAEEGSAAVVTYTITPMGTEFIAEMENCAADALTEGYLAECENDVNEFLTTYHLAVSQAQFDALMDLRFQCPEILHSLSRFTQLLIDGSYVDVELSDALQEWSVVDGAVQEEIAARRLRDAKLFLYGDYAGEVALDKTVPLTEDVQEMHLSEDGINFIKIHEGFTQYAQWDYAQWSIGYGSACNPDDYPNGITEEEADALLREFVATFEGYVNRFVLKHGLTLNQHQYDALVIFSYGCGPGWTSGCRMTAWLLNPTTELEFVDAMGAWCHAGGDVLSGLVRRRILEAQIFLYGDYVGNNSPQYTAVCFQGNGGTLVAADRDHDIRYYNANEPYGVFPTAQYDGYTLEGWYDKNGQKITTSTIAGSYLVVYARWVNSSLSFTDILSSAWYYQYVKEAVEAKLFSGISATTFAPNDSMTRAMLVSVLYRLDGRPDYSGSVPFTDVPDDQWYSGSVVWAYQNKIVAGLDAVTFGPDVAVSREQIVSLLFRYAKYKGYDTSASASLGAFPDRDSTSTYAVSAFQWAVASGIISGIRDGSDIYLAPKETATRAQVATMIVQFIHHYQ